MAKIAILGYGTVGSGVVEVLKTNQISINRRAETEIELKYVLDLREFPGSPIEHVLTHDYMDILKDEEVDIVVEVMGGIEPAYTFVKQALEKGKSVVTSNKELVAKHGPHLLEIAKEHHVNFLFEASVGGGIPIIRPLNQSLTADEIYEIEGILNGTTNYILSKMKDEGLDFDVALKEAQDLGFAERNPESDIEGHDTCRKIAILSSLAFGWHVDYENIYTEGITKITQKDMVYAKAMGMDIKLLGRCKKEGDRVCLAVMPMLIRANNPLNNVHGVFNAILIKGNVIGDVMFYGAGAGKLPTASAVVADIIDASKHKGKNIIVQWSMKKMKLMPMADGHFNYFIRVKLRHETEGKAFIEKTFNHVEWVQVEKDLTSIGFITDTIREGDIALNIEKLSNNEAIIAIESMIRLER